jgi:hypothetical protein
MRQTHPHPVPVHHAPSHTVPLPIIPGRSGLVASNKIGTRTGAAAVSLRSHSVIDSARQASKNNPQVLTLVHGAAHALAQLAARLHVQFSIGPASSSPNPALQVLSTASLTGSSQSQAAIKTDLADINQLNASLGQLGLQVNVAPGVNIVDAPSPVLGGRSSYDSSGQFGAVYP